MHAAVTWNACRRKAGVASRTLVSATIERGVARIEPMGPVVSSIDLDSPLGSRAAAREKTGETQHRQFHQQHIVQPLFQQGKRSEIWSLEAKLLPSAMERRQTMRESPIS